ncbi:MAG: hypothetical protein NC483_07550 [Ruminococcus sp.]|nr:hypothetical protein [Ruminococcus sp.]
MNTATIIFDKDKSITVPIGTTYKEICEHSIYKDTALALKKNNEIVALTDKVTKDATIDFFDCNSLIGTQIYKASIKFIFEVALKTLYPGSEVYFEHSVPGGMLGSITYSRNLTKEEIANINNEMLNIISSDTPILKYNILTKDAIKFYREANMPEKAFNVQTNDNIVTMYSLKNYLNYFYVSMPSSTIHIKEFELIYLDNNQFILLYPSNLTKGKMPKYTPSNNIIKAFYDAKSWLKKLNTPYISDLNNLVSSSNIKGFIESSELHFNDQIRECCLEIVKNPNYKFVMLAGPSSSGKTTTTRVLCSYLRSIGYNPISISTDDYFVERENTPKDEFGDYNYECLEAIDIELLNNDLVRLLKGEEVDIPSYNFLTGHKEYHNHVIKLQENSIILMEGLHSLNDKLTPNLPVENKFKVYLSPFIPINVDRHNYISTIDLRLIRRIIRDNRTRGMDITATMKSWQSVRNGEEQYIFPYVENANMIINTALPYEIGVLKVYIEPLLLSLNNNSPYYEDARRLIKFLKSFYPISSEYVDKSSILREFIGGNNND